MQGQPHESGQSHEQPETGKEPSQRKKLAFTGKGRDCQHGQRNGEFCVQRRVGAPARQRL